MLYRPEWSGLKKLLAVHAMTKTGISTVDDTATGNPATFDTTLIRPLKSCVASFSPVQAGSGNPSPDNVRPISGWTGLTVYHSGEDTSNPDEIAVAWQTEAGTVYGGTVDLVSGELIVTHILIPNTSFKYSSAFGDCVQIISRYLGDENVKGKSVISDRGSTEIASGTVGRISLYLNNIYANMAKEQFATFDDNGVQQWLTEYNPQFVVELQEPILIETLAAQQIMAIAGTNKIWSNADENVSVTYTKKG